MTTNSAALDCRPSLRDEKFPGLLRSAILVFLVSFACRGLWVSAATVTPVSDFAGYDAIAVNLIKTGQIGCTDGRAYRTPAYPAFLASIYYAVGHQQRAVQYAQAFLTAVGSAMVFLLAARFMPRGPALIAGLLHAFWITSVVYVPVLASENLAEFLAIAAVLCAAAVGPQGRFGTWAVVLSGACYGVGVLARPALVFFGPGLVVCLLAKRASVPVRLGRAAAFLCAAAFVVVPWLIRNASIGFGFTTLATAGGMNLYMGNSPRATNGGWERVATVPEYEQLSENERNQAYMTAASEWIQEHPLRYVALCGVRAARFFGDSVDTWAALALCPTHAFDEAHLATRQIRNGAQVDHWVRRVFDETEARNVKVLQVLRTVVAPVMLVGLLLATWNLRRWYPLVIPILSYAGGIIATFGAERFRNPTDPLLLIIVAGLVSDSLRGTACLGRWPPGAFKTAATLIALFIAAMARGVGVADEFYHLAPACNTRADAENLQQFEPVLLDRSAAEYASTRWAPRHGRLVVEHVDGGLQCTVAASPEEGSHYGGMEIPVSEAKALRLRLSFTGLGHVTHVFVDGYDAGGRRCTRWRWRVGEHALPPHEPTEFILLANRQCGHFAPEGDGELTTAQTVHVFLRVLPGAKAKFVLHAASVGR